MRVKELNLHNFRGIKDLHLVFNVDHNVVVLVGVNGVGKSSIIDCINLLIKYHVAVHNTYYLEDDAYFFGARFIPDFSDFLLTSDVRNHSNNSINEISCSHEKLNLKWKLSKFMRKSDYMHWEEIHEKSKENIGKSSKLNLVNHYFYYLSNRQVIDSNKFAINNDRHSRRVLFEKREETDKIIDFEDFSKWFRYTEDLENETRLSDDNQYHHPQLAAVRQAVYSLLGEGYRNLTFKRAIDKMTIKKSGQEIALELLSDGEKSLLAMVGHLSRKLSEYNPDLVNPLEASALVLIDEIELHLHPAWQRTIIPRLTQTFPNCQFIVTTHSPQVLSHVDPECIHILDYDGDNVVVKRPDSSYGLDSNRILEDILGVPKRPQEIQDRMSELFRTINNNDLEGAKKIVQELGDKIGIDEPELVKAEATIKRREIIGR